MANTIQHALTTFDRVKAAERSKRADQTRRDFVHKFPTAGWADLPLERYALGVGDAGDSVSGCVEFRTPDLGGVGGGSAAKHVIFKRKGRPGWYYPQPFKNEQEAWTGLRAGVVAMLDHASAGRWEEAAEQLPFQYAVSIWLKTLHLYFPEEILAIYSRDHMKHFWQRLTGEPPKAVKSFAPLLLNRRLLEHLRTIPELAGFDNRELMYFMYHWDDPRAAVAVYKIAPGEDAKIWPQCLAGQYMAVGWGDVGDLSTFEDFDAFEKRFKEAFNKEYGDHAAGKATATRKARELWKLTKIEPGDLILANKGKSEILGVGEVQDPPYEFDDPAAGFPHRIRVTWDTSKARTIPAQSKWAFMTIAPVSLEEYERMMLGSAARSGKRGDDPPPKVDADPELVHLAERLEERKQLILYGPPGTGKTYTARRFILHWLLQAEGQHAAGVLADRAKFQAEWRRLTKATSPKDMPQVTLVTFHPSYGYEDFVEGYRPRDGSGSGLQLQLEDGLFLRVCDTANRNPSTRFVLMIDEINRANLPRVLGELVTVLEADKRGLSVTLPQSKRQFAVPENVYLVGTMNTADRSIRVLDAAVRRRFTFHEVMPDPSSLSGVQFGGLVLEDFLEFLNESITKREGREKQIGHAVLMDEDEAISSAEEFVKRLRYEVIPVLQEYCYEDYRTLAEYLGEEIVDAEGQRLKLETLQRPDLVVAAIVRHMGSRTQ